MFAILTLPVDFPSQQSESFWKKARQKINQTVVLFMSCKSFVDVHKVLFKGLRGFVLYAKNLFWCQSQEAIFKLGKELWMKFHSNCNH